MNKPNYCWLLMFVVNYLTHKVQPREADSFTGLGLMSQGGGRSCCASVGQKENHRRPWQSLGPHCLRRGSGERLGEGQKVQSSHSWPGMGWLQSSAFSSSSRCFSLWWCRWFVLLAEAKDELRRSRFAMVRRRLSRQHNCRVQLHWQQKL